MLVDVMDGRFVVVEGPVTRETHDLARRGVLTFMDALKAGDRVHLLSAGHRGRYERLDECSPLSAPQARIAADLALGDTQVLSLCATLEEMGCG